VDQTGSIYLTGEAGGPGFPTTPNAFQPNYANAGDGFVAKIAFPVPGIPVATLSVPPTIPARGQPGTFILGVTGASDPAAVYSFHINWGDGTSQTVSGPAGTAVNHIYTSCGTPGSTYVVQVTGTDQAGNPLQPSYHLAGVAPVVLQGAILVVGGTTSADKIYLTAADSTGKSVNISINGTSWGTFQPGQIVVYGQAGNDTIQIKSAIINKQTVYVTVPAVLFGGDGNNTLDASGSTANNVLVGGAGTDHLTGGRGRDLLIGGRGSDTLTAGSGDDILIGGSTIWDLASPTLPFSQQLLALNAIMAEWGSSDPYATRVNYLQNGGGLNGSVVLNASTIVEDSTAIDTLVGAASPALDWFIIDALAKDIVKNARSGEVITTL
jgi:Ca2+-binding RTX toxin-like protein